MLASVFSVEVAAMLSLRSITLILTLLLIPAGSLFAQPGNENKPADGETKPGEDTAEESEPEIDIEGLEEKENPNTPFFRFLQKEAAKAAEDYTTAQEAYNKEKTPANEQKLNAAAEKALDVYRELLTLADPQAGDLPDYINLGRIFIGSLYFNNFKDYHRAAVVFEFVANELPSKDANALTAANSALTARRVILGQSKKAFPDADHSYEEAQVVRLLKEVINRFPTSAEAMRARKLLAGLYFNYGQPEDAARTYTEIPSDAAEYEVAQSQAGVIYWYLYRSPEKLENPPPEDDTAAREKVLNELRKKAKQALTTGTAQILALAEQNKTDDSPPNLDGAKFLDMRERLATNRYSLAQIEISQGNYQGALDQLTKGPLALAEMIEVKNEADGFASEKERKLWAQRVYERLFQIHVGLRNTDEAKKMIGKLEDLVDPSDSESLTRIYFALGRNLEEELENAEDEEQRAEIRKSFELILDTIAKRTEDQKASNLMWIATTYEAFTKSAEDETAKEDYAEKAIEIYETLIAKSREDPEFLKPAYIPQLLLRISTINTAVGNFDEAREAIGKVLAEVNSVETQFTAAEFLVAQAKKENRPKLYEEALMGVKIGEGEVWGYNQLVRKLKASVLNRGPRRGSGSLFGWRELARGKQKVKVAVRQTVDGMSVREKQHIRAWLGFFNTRYLLAQTKTREEEKADYERLVYELDRFAELVGNLPQELAEEFNTLNNDLQDALGQPQTTLFENAILGEPEKPDSDETIDEPEETVEAEATP